MLAQAFAAAPNGFVVIDEAGTIVVVNRALEALFGHAPGTLVGQPVEVLLAPELAPRHRALRQEFFAQPAPRAMGAGRLLHGRHADGHEFPVEIGLNPLPSAQGLLVLGSVVDLSERTALEGAFHGLFEASPFGLLIVDDEGFIALANRVLAGSLGYAPQALVGKPLHELLPPRYRGRHAALMTGYQGSGESRMMGRGRDLTALHADGTEVPVEIGLSRVRWQRRTMTLAAVSDISQRKRLDSELRQANANLEEFTYVASHDLRSPLRGVADLVEWIVDDLAGTEPESVRRNLERVRQRVQRMERLIDELLSYARAGRVARDYAPIELEALVRSIVELQPMRDGLRLELDLAVEPFLATRTPLETALRNLLGNACKHHDRASGQVRVSAVHDDNWCVISVADDGPGVPPAAQQRVFKLFQTATSAERGSTGIGLALTKRLTEAHGGTVELVSPWAEGRGACFRLRWPRFPRRTHDEDPR
ncbi:MAG: PAS domain S-box protein [Burkholderiales bacterium]|nr:PAS domain S-box protein [Burkholderiales bacterium]